MPGEKILPREEFYMSVGVVYETFSTFGIVLVVATMLQPGFSLRNIDTCSKIELRNILIHALKRDTRVIMFQQPNCC